MKSYFLLSSAALVLITATHPHPGDRSDHLQTPEISQTPDFIAGVLSEGTNSIFTTTGPSGQSQPSIAGDLSAGLSSTYLSSAAVDPSVILPGSPIPFNFNGDAPPIAATTELLASERLYQSDPPCINGFWAACCHGEKLCIPSKIDRAVTRDPHVAKRCAPLRHGCWVHLGGLQILEVLALLS
ncbi:hypothetical protein MMC07_007436 [Pseudocyphellaria aurata]|nr:hypothetical protein [Pseudocyphellaria aurata]